MNYDKLKHVGNIMIPAIDPKPEKAKAGWTHIKRQPVHRYSKAEIDVFVKNNPDISKMPVQ